MNKPALLASTAAALILCAAAATAQMREKGSEKEGPAQMQGGPGSATGGEGRAQREPGRAGEGKKAQQKVGPREGDTKGTAQREPKDRPDKGRAETRDREKGPKGTAETRDELRQKGTKGSAEKGIEPRDRKGTAERERIDKDRKGTAERERIDKDRKGTAERERIDKDRKGTAERKDRDRVQLSERQRTTLRQTLIRDRDVNRVTRVNFSISVGTRVPRSIRLVALPAAVVAIVPEYRSYRYFVVDDRICIVHPTTYEIVEVISVSTTTAGRADGRLVLTEKEREIILSEIDLDRGSTLALGVLSEGADVPRRVELRRFPEVVVERVPKVRNYRYFTAENRVAIVDPRRSKVELVIGGRN